MERVFPEMTGSNPARVNDFFFIIYVSFNLNLKDLNIKTKRCSNEH